MSLQDSVIQACAGVEVMTTETTRGGDHMALGRAEMAARSKKDDAGLSEFSAEPKHGSARLTVTEEESVVVLEIVIVGIFCMIEIPQRVHFDCERIVRAFLCGMKAQNV